VSFNNWDAVSHPLKRRPGRSNIHATTVPLSPGRHEYKFIVNGQWLCDPAYEHRVSSGLGTMNSVVEVV